MNEEAVRAGAVALHARCVDMWASAPHMNWDRTMHGPEAHEDTARKVLEAAAPLLRDVRIAELEGELVQARGACQALAFVVNARA